MICTKCKTENPEGLKFCNECGASFKVSCASCGFENVPTAKFCGNCGLPIGGSTAVAVKQPGTSIRLAEAVDTEALEGERKTVTALFADIKGSMELMEDLDPEEARAIVDPVLKLMIDAVQRYGGYVVQSTGDGIFALFGAPVAHEDHPQRALYAALRLQEAARRYSAQLVTEGGTPLEARVGINTGEVVVRTLATTDGHTEYTPIGHTANLASRMQAIAPTGSIAITEQTRRLVEGFFQVESLGPTRVKGLTEPINVYEVIGLGPLRTRLQRAAARGLTRFVGRDREMETLRHALEQARAGHGQIVAAMAEPGVGKSRLFYEFKATSQYGCAVLEAYSVSHGKASAYLPVIELLREYFEISSDDDDRKRRERILGKVLGLDRGLEDTLPYFYSLYGISDTGDSLAQMDPNIKRRRTLEAIKRVLLRESLNEPLIVVFEDLHWIDSETQALLNLLVDAIANARILLLVNYRPEYRHDWGSRTHYTQLRLDPLGRDSAAHMLTALLGDEPELTPLKRLIADRTEGNPFFVEEMVQALFERGVIGHDEKLVLKGSLADVKIPSTVQALLASRMDRLPTEEKALLQTLAVIGREFTLPLIRRVAGSSEAQLERILVDLQRGEFIYEQPAFPDAQYIFKHALTQEVAYNSLLLERREHLHNRVACAIEEISDAHLDEHYGELAHHYGRSGDRPNAIKYLQLAGQQAIQRSAYGEAITHLTVALESLKTLPEMSERVEQELMLQIALGTALSATRGWAAPEVESAYTRARQLCQRAGETPQLVAVLWGLWAFYYMRLECRVASELAEQLFRLARDTNDPGLLIVAHHAMSNTCFALGEFTRARDHLEQSLALYNRREHRHLASLMGGEEPAVVCRTNLAATLWCLGYPEQDLQQSHDALSLAQELGSAFNLAFALGMDSIHRQFRRERQIAQQLAEAAIDLATEQGVRFYLVVGSIVRGWAVAEQDDRKAGIAQIEQGVAESRAMGIEAHLPYDLGLLAEAYCKERQSTEGLTAVREALDLVNKTGARYYEAELHRTEGELMLTQSEPDDVPAESCFRSAIDVAHRQSAKSWELRATVSLAQLLRDTGRRHEARTMLAEIYNWFTEGFDTADLKDAKALLDELSA
jgi:predicted ATPase/class 3 adenylate cyclase